MSESPPHVDDNEYHCDEDGIYGIGLEFFANFGSDGFLPPQPLGLILNIAGKIGFESGFYGVCDGRAFGFFFHANEDVVDRAEFFDFAVAQVHGLVLNADIAQGLADVADRGRGIKVQFEQCAAGKVDAQVITAFGDGGSQAEQDEHSRQDESAPSNTEKVDAGVAKYAQPADAEAGIDLARDNGVVNGARDKDGGEHRGDDTDHQGECKSLNGTGAVLVEHDGGDDGGYVGIYDGLNGARITIFNGYSQGFFRAQFLADAFEDQHVGIYCHTDG